MTDQVPTWYKDQWAQQVIVRFQNAGFMLKGTTTPPVRIEGNNFKFLRTASVDAQLFTSGDEVATLNPNDDLITFASQEWDAAVRIRDYDVTRLGVLEVDARQIQCTKALGRRADRIIYDAIMSASLPSSQIFGSYTTPMDPYLMLQGLQQLVENDVPVEEGVYCPVPSLAFAQMETYKIFANQDWVGPDLPLTKMVKHKSWDVGHFFILPPHLRKAYTSSTTQLRFRVWSRSAVGAGHNIEMKTEWEREAKKKSWWVNHTMDGCAVALQTEGIIEYRMKFDPTAIAQETINTHSI